MKVLLLLLLLAEVNTMVDDLEPGCGGYSSSISSSVQFYQLVGIFAPGIRGSQRSCMPFIWVGLVMEAASHVSSKVLS
jgi:hypothetical protein